jgi:hypothetical protein
LIDKLTAADGVETRVQHAEDRMKCVEMALRTPGFPKPFKSEVDATERELKEAKDEWFRIDGELQEIDKELGDA